MPAFITDGPDIPERLLEAHEDGRVVFFCGAGISFPAKLPSFKGLVTGIYRELGVTPDPVQAAAIKDGMLDTALGLLEVKIVGGREKVREAAARILIPNLSVRGALQTHKALLTLAKSRNGHTRLVTTNFDRLFIEAGSTEGIPEFAAPLLPVPKNRWNGLVYLHGLLPPHPTQMGGLANLVLSSGDFGLAYLAERWAARFVSELFRNYTVCFVGYSINDPVMRYMMDALAADRLLGELSPEMFAFASFARGNENSVKEEWQAKNVTPILYQQTPSHTRLHKTLHEWAETYRDGTRGKELIVAQHAGSPPLITSRLDYVAGRMLWALTDPVATKYFANLEPVPPLKWLETLTEEQLVHGDLSRFGVAPEKIEDKKLVFSVLRRPAPYKLGQFMCVADFGAAGSRWDDVMVQFANWLSRHLNDPELILWLVKQGGRLDESFEWVIRRKLDDLDKLEKQELHSEIEELKRAAPNAVPSRNMRVLWRLLLTHRVRTRTHDFSLHDWFSRFKHEGLTPSLRIRLREILSPKIAIRKRFEREWDGVDDGEHEPQRISDVVDWELVLSVDHAHSELRDRREQAEWKNSLPALLQDFTLLLRDAMDLMHELEGVSEKSDLSYIHQPSISEHPQNKDFRDWTVLIELTRDAWAATAERSPHQANIAADFWSAIPYPLFRRLTFFAACHGEVISASRALNWLLSDSGWWLWSVETEREALRLIVNLAPRLNASEMRELEEAILSGPPRDMFRAEIDAEEWEKIVDREIWLRIAKAHATGAVLSERAASRLQDLAHQHPDWQLSEDERDEFPYWMGVGDGEDWRRHVHTPRKASDLANWLREQPKEDIWQEDDWRDRCRKSFLASVIALCVLSREGNWPISRWREALQVWAEEDLLQISWRRIPELLDSAPDPVLLEMAHSVARWIQTQAEKFNGQEEMFFALVRRILALQYADDVDDEDPVFRAINHPIGNVTEGLLKWWYRLEPKAGQELPEPFKTLASGICDLRAENLIHGRVLLAAHVIPLFRVDEDWANAYLIPLFDWKKSEREARAAWKGFLWSPRLYRPLLAILKGPLLETASRFDQLGKHGNQYADFLTFAALDPGDTFTYKELADAINRLPSDGLLSSAHAVTRALESAGDKRGEYWKNRVLPFFRTVWPKLLEKRTSSISEAIGRLIVAADESFPDAIDELRGWLQPLHHPDYVIHRLHNAKISQRFPERALEFMAAVVGSNSDWLPRELKQCLDEVEIARPALAETPQFRELLELCRRRGLS